MSIAFISDLHLSPAQPGISALFEKFLQQEACNHQALYILGDLFEYWIGDDAIHPAYEPFIHALRQLNERGVASYFIHGNRDFLVGKRFSELSTCQILEEKTVIDLFGRKAALMHGDTLCTDDVEYQKFRATVRNPAWQQHVLSLTVAQRQELAQQYRQLSQESAGLKSDDIMDVNQNEVEREFEGLDVELIIHGHTHRPQTHDLNLNGKSRQRIVLGDWGESAMIAIADENGVALKSFS